jgi:hypothetical protein
MKVSRLIYILGLIGMALVLMAPSTILIGVQDFYKETGIKSDVDLRSVPPGGSIDGVVVDPDTVKKLGVESDIEQGSQARITHHGKGKFTITFPGSKETIIFQVKDF